LAIRSAIGHRLTARLTAIGLAICYRLGHPLGYRLEIAQISPIEADTRSSDFQPIAGLIAKADDR
jgi:hypothetical protein